MLVVGEAGVPEAISMLKESLSVYQALDLPAEIAECLSSFAAVAAEAGGAELAARLLSSSRARFEELGSSVPWYIAKRDEGALLLIHERLDDAAFAKAWEDGAGLTQEEAIALAFGVDFDA